MNCSCMHVDILLKVLGQCQVRVFCAALYRISAELLQVDTCGILKYKKRCLCMYCFCATWTRNNNQVETLFKCTIEINFNEQQNCGDTLLCKILFLSVFMETFPASFPSRLHRPQHLHRWMDGTPHLNTAFYQIKIYSNIKIWFT